MFISLEGIDGSGKTTQSKLLRDALLADEREVILLREPGGTPLGERLRNVILDHEVPVGPKAELLLFLTARAELVESVIRGSLDGGTTVICDRFSDSTYAYQGAAEGNTLETIEQMCEIATQGLWPDLTLLLRVDADLAAKRAKGKDRFEREGLDFQRGVVSRYDEIAECHPDRVRVIDAAGSVNEVHERVIAAVRSAVA